MTDGETKATHVVTIQSPGIQANFKIATDQSNEELAAEIQDALNDSATTPTGGTWTCEDPDTGAMSVIARPGTPMYIVQVFDAPVFEKMVSDARYEQQRQQAAARFDPNAH